MIKCDNDVPSVYKIVLRPQKITGETRSKKSGNWGLDEIDCHRSHKGQCTSNNTFLHSYKNFFEKNFGIKILGKKIFEKKNLEKKLLKKKF